MHDHHLVDMVDGLVKAGVVAEADTEKAKAVFDEYWEDKIALTWTTEDVIELAKHHGIIVTEEQARYVLMTTFRRHDATIGVNWDVLDFHIDGLGELPECESDEDEDE